MSYTTPAEAAKIVRDALKRKGWTSRDVSVRAESFSMGSALRVRVKNAAVPLDEVERIANEQEKIDRCAITGDILSGGNRYVSVSYTSEALEVIAVRAAVPVAKAVEELEAISSATCLVEVEGTPYLIGYNSMHGKGYGYSLWKDGSHACNVYDVKNVCQVVGRSIRA